MLFTLVGLIATLQQPASVSRVAVNDNRVAAGRVVNGELRIRLDARLGRWFPDSDRDPSRVMQVFAEQGKAPQIPGPLIRVRSGMRIRASISNTLRGSSLTLYGFHARPGSPRDTVQIAAGKTREVSFVAGAPGTYFYWASTTGDSIESRVGIDSQLSGAIVVDSASVVTPPRDRIFVLGLWHADKDTTGPKPWVDRDVMVINGKSWPHTERFTFTVGDTVRWRWVNPTTDAHPMHLHGFYYQVQSRGSWAADTVFPSGGARSVVTELMMPGSTMSTTWVPTVAGNWLMHCHFAFHVSHYLSFLTVPEPDDPGSAGATEHAVHDMRGLVVGITVRDRSGVTLASAPTSPARNIRLLIQTARARYDSAPGYGFVAQDTPTSIPRDSVPLMSPTLVLTRNAMTRFTIVNHLRAPSSVHWHGIELANSYYDGVPGWSGTPTKRAPLIAPNDSFVVAFAPPRAGTFMYHSHANETHQIASGLYGALIVLDSGQTTERDRIFVLGGDGPTFEHGRVNGERTPREEVLRSGVTYRFRIVQINPDFRVFASIFAGDSTLQSWRAVAKDGADLPSWQATVQSSRVLMGPGETADYEVTLPRGQYRLEFKTQLDGWTVAVPLRVID